MSKQLALFMAMGIVIAVTGCSGFSVGAPPATPTNIVVVPPTSPPSPTSPPTATPVPATATPNPAANPLDALTRAFRGWSNVKTFRVHLTTTTAAKVTTESNMDVVLPGRFHLTSKATEVIKIDNDFYVKTGNTWRKVTLNQSFDFSVADWKKYLDELGASTDVKFIGAEVLDGAPMAVYQYTVTLKTPVPTTSTSKVWVGVADGLPHKAETVSKTGSTTVLQFTDYNNPSIVIEPPIK